MLTVRRSNERGHASHGWLDSHHSFSFADYYDPRHMGIRALRVLNDDRVDPGAGFPTHGHRDMEIVSYVLEGALAHRDSMGTGSVIRPGDVQRMSAGTGVRHSEMNASRDESVHFLQIWFLPSETGIAPGYEQKHFPSAEKRGRLRIVASPDGAEGSVRVRSPVRLYAGLFDDDERAEFPLETGHEAYVFVASGGASVNGVALAAGDAISVRDERSVRIDHGVAAELLVFDLA